MNYETFHENNKHNAFGVIARWGLLYRALCCSFVTWQIGSNTNDTHYLCRVAITLNVPLLLWWIHIIYALTIYNIIQGIQSFTSLGKRKGSTLSLCLKSFICTIIRLFRRFHSHVNRWLWKENKNKKRNNSVLTLWCLKGEITPWLAGLWYSIYDFAMGW